MDEPTGTVLFTTVGRPYYGFDVFSLDLASRRERRLTDGVSINFNAQFASAGDDEDDDDPEAVVFVSERTGCPRVYLARSGFSQPEPLLSAPGSLFHDRPILRNGLLYFISAHEAPDKPFAGWSALYSADLEGREIARLTPYGSVDYSPAVSQSGKFVAVASYGSRPWGGEFHALNTDIRVVVAEGGGWPTWSGDSVVYFHRKADDGWWSIFRVEFEFPQDTDFSRFPLAPTRVTPPGVHCFTPAAMPGSNKIAVATRRRGTSYRHIEIFDAGSESFVPITEPLNPNFHHYNPFVSPGSRYVGYHRFRGESTGGESRVPNIEPVASPIKGVQMLRLNGAFPSSSPDGQFVAFNHDFEAAVNGGVKIVRSDGSSRWTLIKDRTAFYNSWSPTEKNVIYTSIGPIFDSPKTTVQIARIKFDLSGPERDVACDVKVLTREDTGNNAFPSCSPDGKWLVFRSGRTGHKNLFIVDAANGEFDGGIRQLTDGPWIDTMPSWSPNNDLIAFSSNRHNPGDASTFSIYLIRPDGSDLRRVHLAGPEGSPEVDRERINHVCFSRDGEWLLFTANLGGVTAEPVSWPNQFQPYGELYVVRLDGSGLKRLTWNGFENGTPAWHSMHAVGLGDPWSATGEGWDEDKLRGQFEEPLWISCDI
ncbi:hypothetical protein EUGRSUZ_L00886 [Eucalyptus grandis]|uniref:Dipeptidylpeptidase IV N-terminal domain-containing protein n=1 Tax=Eucalyptus grandis TaxID=71139 RepID=A0A058ZUH4_EUCGR|nr:hypothetical protein EUGRSUZ_L00886 [Eucalyptus grandis]